jgi:hypothetical protein
VVKIRVNTEAALVRAIDLIRIGFTF